jgi:hypothetical protein
VQRSRPSRMLRQEMTGRAVPHPGPAHVVVAHEDGQALGSPSRSRSAQATPAHPTSSRPASFNSSPTCAVIVTSRNQLASPVASEGARPITLDLFSVNEGIALLASRLGAEYVASEPKTVNELIERCARLPLVRTCWRS